MQPATQTDDQRKRAQVSHEGSVADGGAECAGRIRRAQPSCDARPQSPAGGRCHSSRTSDDLLAAEPAGALGGIGRRRGQPGEGPDRGGADQRLPGRRDSAAPRRAARRRARHCRSRSRRCARTGRGRCASPASRRRAGGRPRRRGRRDRRGAAPVSPARGRKSGSCAALGEFVPRADREAIVAAIDAVADRRAKLERDHALVLDRQVRDAAPRVEPIGRGERRGRAGVETAPAGAAMVGLGRRRDRAPGSDRSRRETATSRIARETRLVCLPCQPIPACCASGFSMTGAVSTKSFKAPGHCPSIQCASAFSRRFKRVVVVAAARIDRDGAAIGRLQRRQRIVLGGVIDAEHDDGAGLGPQRLRVAAPLGGAGEPAHVAVIAAGDELGEPGARLGFEQRPRQSRPRRTLGRARSRIAARIGPAIAQPRPR